MKHIETIISGRAAKLEQIKPFISLKSYGELLQKLEMEKGMALGKDREVKASVEKRERPQALPKSLFTERTLPRKTIRID